MTNNKPKKIKLWIPLSLLVINIILTYLFIEEFIDAAPPNYGQYGYLTPITSIISLLYIRKFKGEKLSYLVRILQVLNWIFIFFPIGVILLFALALMVAN